MADVRGPDDLELDPEITAFALDFTRRLCARDFDGAAGLVDADAVDRLDASLLRAAFEAMIPADWGETEPLQVLWTMSDWPGRSPAEIAAAYIAIPGEVYSEAVTLKIGRRAEAMTILEVEFGRP